MTNLKRAINSYMGGIDRSSPMGKVVKVVVRSLKMGDLDPEDFMEFAAEVSDYYSRQLRNPNKSIILTAAFLLSYQDITDQKLQVNIKSYKAVLRLYKQSAGRQRSSPFGGGWSDDDWGSSSSRRRQSPFGDDFGGGFGFGDDMDDGFSSSTSMNTTPSGFGMDEFKPDPPPVKQAVPLGVINKPKVSNTNSVVEVLDDSALKDAETTVKADDPSTFAEYVEFTKLVKVASGYLKGAISQLSDVNDYKSRINLTTSIHLPEMKPDDNTTFKLEDSLNVYGHGSILLSPNPDMKEVWSKPITARERLSSAVSTPEEMKIYGDAVKVNRLYIEYINAMLRLNSIEVVLETGIMERNQLMSYLSSSDNHSVEDHVDDFHERKFNDGDALRLKHTCINIGMTSAMLGLILITGVSNLDEVYHQEIISLIKEISDSEDEYILLQLSDMAYLVKWVGNKYRVTPLHTTFL